jgi:hypothetical protein
MCTAMLWDPAEKEKEKRLKIEQKSLAKERLRNMKKKQSLFKIISQKLKGNKKIITLFFNY